VLFSRPSVDVLFESAADAYGNSLAGVILTGANSDGAEGLHAIAAAGGLALIQTPASAQASAMPEAALEACPAARVLSLAAIAKVLSTDLLAEVP
jgi:two-component system chemotaxis response regulator CheB